MAKKSEVKANVTEEITGEVDEVISENFPELITHGSITYNHHLFKLRLGMFKRNTAPDEQPPRWEDTEHVHFFHTINSNGQEQTRSTNCGGHFHEMIITPNPKGAAHPPKVECSGPMREAIVTDENGVKKKIPVPLKFDKHSHDIEYKYSTIIKPRSANTEAAKVQERVEAKGRKLDGALI